MFKHEKLVINKKLNKILFNSSLEEKTTSLKAYLNIVEYMSLSVRHSFHLSEII